MHRNLTTRLVGVLALAVVAAACTSADDTAADPSTTTSDTSAPTTESTSTLSSSTSSDSIASGTESPAPSTRFPEILGVVTETVLDQGPRAGLGGRNTYYWPDGNIGTLTAADGTTRFFAANGPLPAQTSGSATDPGITLLTEGRPIQGISAEFAYAAGGPVYRDEASGMILLWYHAERHLRGDPANFHATIGLARSFDDGASFEDLGIIIEPNADPDPAAPCCVDVGGAPVIVRDGMFHLWFRDRIGGAAPVDIQLARASAPVAEVVAAALDGATAPWSKHGSSGPTDGLGGRPVPLETGNPRTSWFDVAWHDDLQRYLMVIATHGGLTDPSLIEVTSSVDGLEWTPRQEITACDCELTYPSFLATDGPERTVGNELTVVYVATSPTAEFRWQDTRLQRATVELSGELVTGPSRWTFDDDAEGWVSGGTVASLASSDGSLQIEASGPDPFVSRSGLGLSAAEFGSLRIAMASESAGTGQVFFTTVADPGIDEARSIRFNVEASGVEPVEYVIDLRSNPGWVGVLDTLRVDPIDQDATTWIDQIEVVPSN